MKKPALSFILATLICLSSAAADAQLSFGLGTGIGGMGAGVGGRDIIRISPTARARLHDYLVDEYKKDCGPKVKDPSDDCDDTRALYTSSNLPEKDSEPLPKDVIHDVGFVPPGTEYMQAGYVVYLVRMPRRIILDSVSLNDKDNSIYKYFNKQE